MEDISCAGTQGPALGIVSFHIMSFRMTPGRRGYHNKEWGRMMKEVGLYPSNTGQPGGKETGEQMTHYVMEDGPFDQACRDLLAAGFRITWHEKGAEPPATPEGGEGGNPSGAPAPRKNRTNRYKYTCPRCGLNAWGKPTIKLMCGQCQVHLVRRGYPPSRDNREHASGLATGQGTEARADRRVRPVPEQRRSARAGRVGPGAIWTGSERLAGGVEEGDRARRGAGEGCRRTGWVWAAPVRNAMK